MHQLNIGCKPSIDCIQKHKRTSKLSHLSVRIWTQWCIHWNNTMHNTRYIFKPLWFLDSELRAWAILTYCAAPMSSYFPSWADVAHWQTTSIPELQKEPFVWCCLIKLFAPTVPAARPSPHLDRMPSRARLHFCSLDPNRKGWSN